jgi:hypothetical protein
LLTKKSRNLRAQRQHASPHENAFELGDETDEEAVVRAGIAQAGHVCLCVEEEGEERRIGKEKRWRVTRGKNRIEHV